MNKLMRSMVPQINHAVAAAKQFEETFGTTRTQLAAWYNQHRTLRPVLKQVAEQYVILDKTSHRRAVPVLRRHGWFRIAPYLDPHELLELADVHSSKGAAASDKFICRRFSRNRHERLRRVTRDWWRLSYMKRRRSKAMAALRAYKQGQYCLAIPTLLPLVDGLASAYFRANPGKRDARHGKPPTVLVKDAALLYREVRPDHANLLLTALTDHIYARYQFGTTRAPSALNRHGILHGEIVKYDTEKNALRTILLLDAICRVALAGPVVP